MDALQYTVKKELERTERNYKKVLLIGMLASLMWGLLFGIIIGRGV